MTNLRSRDRQPTRWLRIGIPVLLVLIWFVGGGIGGLYAALLLQSQGIPYEILEASDHIGGRLYTHKFSNETHDYYVSMLNNLFVVIDNHSLRTSARCASLTRPS